MPEMQQDKEEESREPFLHPPSDLHFGSITLVFDKYFEPVEHPELVPFYHFKMVNPFGESVGHLNFRVGATRHIRLVAGHIGYFVSPEHRGRAYAYMACMAAAPFVRRFFDRAVITAETDRSASIRTILRLGAEFVDETDVPPDDPAYAKGERRKRRYLWTP